MHFFKILDKMTQTISPEDKLHKLYDAWKVILRNRHTSVLKRAERDVRKMYECIAVFYGLLRSFYKGEIQKKLDEMEKDKSIMGDEVLMSQLKRSMLRFDVAKLKEDIEKLKKKNRRRRNNRKLVQEIKSLTTKREQLVTLLTKTNHENSKSVRKLETETQQFQDEMSKLIDFNYSAPDLKKPFKLAKIKLWCLKLAPYFLGLGATYLTYKFKLHTLKFLEWMFGGIDPMFMVGIGYLASTFFFSLIAKHYEKKLTYGVIENAINKVKQEEQNFNEFVQEFHRRAAKAFLLTDKTRQDFFAALEREKVALKLE